MLDQCGSKGSVMRHRQPENQAEEPAWSTEEQEDVAGEGILGITASSHNCVVIIMLSACWALFSEPYIADHVNRLATGRE